MLSKRTHTNKQQKKSHSGRWTLGRSRRALVLLQCFGNLLLKWLAPNYNLLQMPLEVLAVPAISEQLVKLWVTKAKRVMALSLGLDESCLSYRLDQY